MMRGRSPRSRLRSLVLSSSRWPRLHVGQSWGGQDLDQKQADLGQVCQCNHPRELGEVRAFGDWLGKQPRRAAAPGFRTFTGRDQRTNASDSSSNQILQIRDLGGPPNAVEAESCHCFEALKLCRALRLPGAGNPNHLHKDQFRHVMGIRRVLVRHEVRFLLTFLAWANLVWFMRVRPGRHLITALQDVTATAVVDASTLAGLPADASANSVVTFPPSVRSPGCCRP